MDIEQFLEYDRRESKHYMPNEIFKDLQSHIEKPMHIAFTYSYYYLISWLYRFAKYGNCNITTEKIKEILGYSSKYKDLNYLIKRNGLLDAMGYTETTRNYPIAWNYNKSEKILEFLLIDDLEEYMKKDFQTNKNRNYTIKMPIKHIYRFKEDQDEGYKSGVFYELDNTHMVEFDTFLFCMNNKKLGVVAFYLYGFLKNKHQKSRGSFEISFEALARKTKIPYSTIAKTIGLLRSYKMIECIHNQEYFVSGLPKEERRPNTYIVNNYKEFTAEPIPYERISVIDYENYLNKKERTIKFGDEANFL